MHDELAERSCSVHEVVPSVNPHERRIRWVVALWDLGLSRLGCIVSVMASAPRSVAEYHEAILAAVQVEHLTVEVERCPHHEAA